MHRTASVNAKLAVDYCKRCCGLVRKMLWTSPKIRPYLHAIHRRRGTGKSFTYHRRIEKVPQENRLPTTGESATVLSQGRH